MKKKKKKKKSYFVVFYYFYLKKSIIKIIRNTYDYVEKYIDRSLGKEHIGYIVDRNGFMEFKKWVLREVEISEPAEAKHNVYWSRIKYPGIK